MSSGGGPGVVERASKEISRRIHSLGFKSSSSKRTKSVDSDPNSPIVPSDSISASTTAAVDKLNGNEVPSDNVSPGPTISPSTPSSSTGMSSKMGTIIKGSVMDKVTHVFGSAGMGNSNNKEKQAAAAANAAAAATATAAAANQSSGNTTKVTTGNAIGTNTEANDPGAVDGSNNSINIPKGRISKGI